MQVGAEPRQQNACEIRSWTGAEKFVHGYSLVKITMMDLFFSIFSFSYVYYVGVSYWRANQLCEKRTTMATIGDQKLVFFGQGDFPLLSGRGEHLTVHAAYLLQDDWNS